MLTISQRLAAFVTSSTSRVMPDEVLCAARMHVLDTVGCALAAHALGEQEAVRSGFGEPNTPAGTALLGGTLAHALDFDDTHDASVCHVSSVAAPAAHAMARAAGRDDRAALQAYVAGCEVTIRLGMAASGDFHRRGLHPTSVCGVFGATAAAGALMGLSEEQLTNAFGLAGSRAAGVLACLAEGAPVKPLHAGWAARDGVECALLAGAGAIGPRGVLEGHQGLFEALLGDSHDESLHAQCADLGERWETAEIAFKALPVCHYMHGVLQALAQLAPDPALVSQIEVAIDDSGTGLVSQPIAVKRLPDSVYAARFALPWCAAATVVYGQLTPALLGHALDDAAVLDLAARVHPVALPRGGGRSTFAGRAEVRFRDGTRRSATVEHPRGSPQKPMTDADVRLKFRANADPALDGDEVARVERRIDAL